LILLYHIMSSLQYRIDKYALDVYNLDMIKEKALKRVDLYIKTVQFNQLQKLADETAVTFSAHVRMALDKYLKSKK